MEEFEVGESRVHGRGGRSSPLPRKGSKKSQKRVYPFRFRLQAVKLYLEEGYSAPEVSSALGVSKHTLYAWAKRYREEGEAGLRVSGRRSEVEYLHLPNHGRLYLSARLGSNRARRREFAGRRLRRGPES